jgi:putative pyruvate formate lyase activating enzyme
VLFARASLHYWEEPCLSGTRGAGTVFFVGCPLGCVYCQNRAIAHGEGGFPVSYERLAEIFLELEAQGAHVIDLVTPTHYAHALREAIPMARRAGLTLPIVYNCGGYESVETLRSLRGLIDVYLPDFKYADPDLAARYSRAPDYPEVAEAALREMVAQCGTPTLNEEGIMTRGVIVRHLMLPSAYRNSHDVIKHLATYGDSIYVSLMNQYTPMAGIGDAYPELASPIRDKDYRRLVAYAVRLGITQAYVQEGGTVSESFIPAFDGEGVRKK